MGEKTVVGLSLLLYSRYNRQTVWGLTLLTAISLPVDTVRPRAQAPLQEVSKAARLCTCRDLQHQCRPGCAQDPRQCPQC